MNEHVDKKPSDAGPLWAIAIILGAILLLLIAGGIYYYLQQQKAQQAQSQVQNSQQQEQSTISKQQKILDCQAQVKLEYDTKYPGMVTPGSVLAIYEKRGLDSCAIEN